MIIIIILKQGPLYWAYFNLNMIISILLCGLLESDNGKFKIECGNEQKYFIILV
jgi:hypothetical protein